MMNKYRYLIKALRAFRITHEGQFGQTQSFTPDETIDAANAIEALIMQVKELQKRLISLDGKNQDQGWYNELPWTVVAEMVEKRWTEQEGKTSKLVASFQITSDGLGIYWK